MSIEDAGTIDGFGIDRDTGIRTLMISDHLDWTDPVEHLNALERKIDAYLGFIQSGQLEQHLPAAVGQKPKIALILQFQPPDNIASLLADIGEQLRKLDVSFGYGPLPNGY